MQYRVIAWILAATAVAGQDVTVMVRDYAGVEKRILRRAEMEADRVLGTAGVQVNWVHCPSPVCDRPPLPTEFVVDVLPAGVTRRGTETRALGYAVPPESGPYGSYAGVLYNRVERLSSCRAGAGIILGHVFAHELGHLLLGVGSHAPAGIMKAEWCESELARASQGGLVFGPIERLRIQENLHRRSLAHWAGTAVAFRSN
jgi:hypothetical protein